MWEGRGVARGALRDATRGARRGRPASALPVRTGLGVQGASPRARAVAGAHAEEMWAESTAAAAMGAGVEEAAEAMVYKCDRGCGFDGTWEDVAAHEQTCSHAGPAVLSAAEHAVAAAMAATAEVGAAAQIGRQGWAEGPVIDEEERTFVDDASEVLASQEGEDSEAGEGGATEGGDVPQRGFSRWQVSLLEPRAAATHRPRSSHSRVKRPVPAARPVYPARRSLHRRTATAALGWGRASCVERTCCFSPRARRQPRAPATGTTHGRRLTCT